FGIAVIEAFSFGLPVYASTYGSLPELITPKTGILCKNYDEFLDAVRGKPKFHPEEIRNEVQERFGIDVITKRYIALYEKVISGKTLNPIAPKSSYQVDAQTLLPF